MHHTKNCCSIVLCLIKKRNVMNIVDEIIEGLNKNYNGMLICEYQNADLFVYIDGFEETIESIDTEYIYFENDYHTVKLYDADIQHLTYIHSIVT